jgi:imidazoleglycerol phosphate dehydratase HisB
LEIDGAAVRKIDTGVPFFDHMLTLFAKHGLFNLDVKAKGDNDVDYHHTVEDVGLVLGEAFKKRWATSSASAATAFSCCRWMNRWPAWSST